MPIEYTAGPPADPTAYIDAIAQIHALYGLDRILVWEDMEDIGYDDFARYIDFYNEVWDQFGASNPSVELYGPNIVVDWDGTLDSDHEQMLLDFIDQANGFHGLAFCADIADEDWNDLIAYVKSDIWAGPLCVTMKGTPTDPQPLHSALGSSDIALWPSNLQDDFTLPTSSRYWKFEGTITVNDQASNFAVRTDILAVPLRGTDRRIQIFSGSLDGTLVYDAQLPAQGAVHTFGSLGNTDAITTYYYRISGLPAATGGATLKVTFIADNITTTSVQGSVTIVG